MRTLTAAVAALGLLGVAGAANAAIEVITPIIADDLHGDTLAPGLVMLENFDDISNGNVLFDGNVITETPATITTSAPPPYSLGVMVNGASVPVDPTDYASVQANQESTFSALNGYYFTAFSFYMGSPDEYNKVVFNLLGGGVEEFQGSDIWGGQPPGDGNRSAGYRVTYDFNGAKVSSIVFSSTSHAFEFDGLAGTLAIPEPGTWALMIMGFGGAGAMLRRRRTALA